MSSQSLLTVYDLIVGTQAAQVLVRSRMADMITDQRVEGEQRAFPKMRKRAMKTPGWRVLAMVNLRYRQEIDRLQEMPAWTTLEELKRW